MSEELSKIPKLAVLGDKSLKACSFPMTKKIHHNKTVSEM